MIKVQCRPNEPLEAALRRFKRQCNLAGIFRLAKKHSSFEKPSEERRREGRERIRAIRIANRKANQQYTGRSTRRPKVRPSTVTPESARRAAEEAKAEQAALQAAADAGPETTVEAGTLKIGSATAPIQQDDAAETANSDSSSES